MWGTLNSQLQMLLGVKGRFTSKLINFGYSLDAKSVSCKCLLLSERKREMKRERSRRRESNKDKDWERDPEKQAKPSAGKKKYVQKKNEKRGSCN